ncbi:MAG: OmpH family outer membrane protein [Muribaculaceae bacterium]|nr:OmpH family outer membrane protein [Muribaculaceae bacterium]MDE7334740.1 OmpH family outer membrane protein [Muribaculaceae bacterium]
MKKLIAMMILGLAGALGAAAQKYALVDMEYILKNYPQYEMANEQLNQLSQRWQREVETKNAAAETLYKNYQAELVFMTDEQKKAKEQEIVAAEKAATDLKYKYFGPEGELYNKRQTLMEPIQDEIYNAIKKIAEEKGYQTVFDRASSANIIYASPRIDISNEVLNRLGYSK